MCVCVSLFSLTTPNKTSSFFLLYHNKLTGDKHGEDITDKHITKSLVALNLPPLLYTYVGVYNSLSIFPASLRNLVKGSTGETL